MIMKGALTQYNKQAVKVANGLVSRNMKRLVLPWNSCRFNSNTSARLGRMKQQEHSWSWGSDVKYAAALGMMFCGTFTLVNYRDEGAKAKRFVLNEAQLLDIEEELDLKTILNWSGTHKVCLPEQSYFEPETIEELEKLTLTANETGTSIRPVGSALSPNGIAFNSKGMVSMAHMDQVISIDKEKQTVTVQAGARVSQVIDELRKHNLTLPNLASIAEQQMGGFVQVGAHGTGANIPPVDEFVTKLKLVTPGLGTIELSKYQNDGVTLDPLFLLARVGLGALGIVAEVTMQCIPAHKLLEHTFVLSRAEAMKRLPILLQNHRHMRFMWIPYEDAVIVVTNDPVVENDEESIDKKAVNDTPRYSQQEQFKPLVDLLLELEPEKYTESELSELGFGEIRDALLAINPLDTDHVKRCNKAEAEFWRRSEGFQIKNSDELLQFDCGGQQNVWEICFPTGKYSNKNDNDMNFMRDLLSDIEKYNIPAHTPIEQRWSSSSSSLLSPAHGCQDGLHSWVGIIMYLPSDEEQQRNEIMSVFKGKYSSLMRRIGNNFGAASHWAKLEVPESETELQDLKTHISKTYPVELFNKARNLFDPKRILCNDLIDAAFSPMQSKDKKDSE